MITLTLNNNIFPLRAWPVIQGDKVLPSGLQFGKQYFLEGSIISSENDISSTYNKIIILSNRPSMESLVQYERTDCISLITDSRMLVEIYANRMDTLVPIFTIDQSHLSLLKNSSDMQAVINVDLSKYAWSVIPALGEIIYDKRFILSELIEKILSAKSMILSLYDALIDNKISIIYHWDEIDRITTNLFNAGHAYKNRFAVIKYRKSNCLSEVHELTHIALYGYGSTAFLFEEGTATMSYDMATIPNRINRFTSTIYAKKMLRENRLPSLLSLLNNVQSNRVYHDDSYQAAGAFCAWLYNAIGKKKYLSCYSKISRANTFEENEYIFKQITNISWLSAEQEWHQSMMCSNKSVKKE